MSMQSTSDVDRSAVAPCWPALRYGSVCAGAGTCALAFRPLGVETAWFAEIEPAPSAVLAHRFPDAPNLGDMTLLPQRIRAREVEATDLFMGGTPCQAFSVAGLRNSLDDLRGNLTLTFVEIANAIDTVRCDDGRQPAVILWENVPGVLSVKDNAFGCFLGALAGSGAAITPPDGGWPDAGLVDGPQRTVCWRVLDAQYFGVAQRRRRVFVVAGSGGFRPESVLFESEGVRRDSAPSREAGESVTGAVTARSGRNGGGANDDIDQGRTIAVFGGNDTGGAIQVAPALNANRGCHNPGDFEAGALCVTGDVTHALKAEGADAGEDGTGRGTPIIAFPAEMSGTACASAEDVGIALSTKHTAADDASPTLGSQSDRYAVARAGMAVRRLTPRECERLQGWPDDHTLVPYRGKPMSDGPRYAP